MNSRAWTVTTLFGSSAMMLMAAVAQPAYAQTAEDFAAMRAEIQALRAAQQHSDAEIADLKAQLGQQLLSVPAQVDQAQPAYLSSASAAADTSWQAVPQKAGGLVVTRAPMSASYASAAGPVNPAGGSGPGYAPVPEPSKLTINGDFRLRYEANFGDQDARNRDRGVLRARLRAAYAVNK